MYEEIKIEKIDESCSYCEDYAKSHSTTPTKIAVMSCEGGCSRGEVSRRAANLIAHKMAKETTVRICLGGAFHQRYRSEEFGTDIAQDNCH